MDGRGVSERLDSKSCKKHHHRTLIDFRGPTAVHYIDHLLVHRETGVAEHVYLPRQVIVEQQSFSP